jgi:hypothetical protein
MSRPPAISARAWSAVVLYRFEDGRSNFDELTLRLGLRTFERIKIKIKIKIMKSRLFQGFRGQKHEISVRVILSSRERGSQYEYFR